MTPNVQAEMIASSEVFHPGTHKSALRVWKPALFVTAFAALLRLVFYSGYFGSDEVTYIESAFKLLHGDWRVDSYAGANRYGVNLPLAGFAWLFGQNEFAAALYSMLCSIAEVAFVTVFGMRMFGQRAGILAGLLLACLPIHVHNAGRLLADSPLCLAITASFLFFWLGETSKSRWAYFAAGCAAGITFWVKPAVVFYGLVLALYPLVFRRFTPRWIWTVLGFALLVIANNILFWALTGNFWFIFELLTASKISGYVEEGLATGTMTTGPGYYVAYLFAKLQHTWLLGYLALAGILGWITMKRRLDTGSRFALGFTVWWALGLVAVLSLLVVSFKPVTLIPKSNNYMLIFVAPLCLLGGTFLACLRGRTLVAACAFVIVPSLVLAVLHQASIQVFTSNSKAAVSFARSHPKLRVYATTNAYRAGQFETLVHAGTNVSTVRPLEHLMSEGVSTGEPETVAIVDTETSRWANMESIRRVEEVPACWQQVGRLSPEGLGVGSAVAGVALRLVHVLPKPIRGKLQAQLEHLSAPEPAFIYRVPVQPCP